MSAFKRHLSNDRQQVGGRFSAITISLCVCNDNCLKTYARAYAQRRSVLVEAK